MHAHHCYYFLYHIRYFYSPNADLLRFIHLLFLSIRRFFCVYEWITIVISPDHTFNNNKSSIWLIHFAISLLLSFPFLLHLMLFSLHLPSSFGVFVFILQEISDALCTLLWLMTLFCVFTAHIWIGGNYLSVCKVLTVWYFKRFGWFSSGIFKNPFAVF